MLFESCVGEAAGSLAVASIFFRGLVPSGVVLGVFWEHLGTQGQRLGSLGAHLGSFGCLFWGLWGSFGVPWVPQGAFVGPRGALWAVLGGRVAFWVAMGAASGKFREILGPILGLF